MKYLSASIWIKLLIGFVIWGFASPIWAETHSEIWIHHLEEADTAYRSGLANAKDRKLARSYFRQAAENYEAVWQLGQHSPKLIRNLAQAHFLAGNLPESLVCYQRGLSQYPWDTELINGLESVRGQVVYPIANEITEPLRPQLPTTSQIPFDRQVIFWMEKMGWLFGWLACGLFWIRRNRGWVIFGLLSLVLAGILAGLTHYEEQRRREFWQKPTVVVKTRTELRTGNSETYPERFREKLPVGCELRWLYSRGDWHQVETSAGLVGWIPRKSCISAHDGKPDS